MPQQAPKQTQQAQPRPAAPSQQPNEDIFPKVRAASCQSATADTLSEGHYTRYYHHMLLSSHAVIISSIIITYLRAAIIAFCMFE
jgi:hypothetical protein